MRQIQTETGESLSFFYKTLIQLYSFYLFFYFYLLYKRGYQRQYFWTLKLKVLAYEAATAWNRWIPCNCSKHWSDCICFVYFSIFDLLYQRGIKGNILDIKSQSVGLWGSYSAKQGIPLKNLRIANHIVFVLSLALLF